jgi:hypothetical protein
MWIETVQSVGVKENSIRYLSKHQDIKTYGGVEVKFHAFLASALHDDEW